MNNGNEKYGGDPEVITTIVLLLIEKFEQCMSAHGNVKTIDRIMVCHNLYKLVIFDIEQHMEEVIASQKPRGVDLRTQKILLRRVVVDTMIEALELGSYYERKDI